MDRLTGKSYSGTNCTTPSVSYTYDAFDEAAGQYGRGLRTGMTDGSGSTTWVYDSRGRVKKETQAITGSGTFVTQWGYNSADQPTWMRYPADNAGATGEQVNYTYLPQGSLDTLINNTGSTTYVRNSEYDAAGRLDWRELGDSGTNYVLKVDYTYYLWSDQNGQGRLQQIATGAPGYPTSRQDLRYTYDQVGNVLTIQDYKAGGTQTQTFAYDAADRLTSAGAAGGSGGTYGPTSYTYNTNTGNLASAGSVTFAYEDTNHKHAVTSRSNDGTYGYDDNGNQITRTVGGQTYNLTYNAENHLTGVSGGATATFTYNGGGERVKGTVDGVTTAYVGNYFEWANGAMVKYYYGGGQRVALKQSATLYFLLGDHLGSTSITATSSGALYSELRYKAWGGERYSSATETPTKQRYTGQTQYEELGGADGLYFYGSRFYDPYLNH